MTAEKNRQILLASRPRGEPSPDNFKLVETAVPEAGPDQMLLHTVYLSLDPYMRGRMDAGASYAQPVEVGKVMEGSAVCAVVKSNLPPYQRSSRFLRVLGDIANKGSLVLGLQTDILHLRKEPLNYDTPTSTSEPSPARPVAPHARPPCNGRPASTPEPSRTRSLRRASLESSVPRVARDRGLPARRPSRPAPSTRRSINSIWLSCSPPISAWAPRPIGPI